MIVFVDGENFRRSLITVLNNAGVYFNDDIFQSGDYVLFFANSASGGL